MPLSDTLAQLMADFENRELPRPTLRALKLPALAGKIDVVLGMRRSGKTWYLYQQIRDRRSQGLGKGRILYLDFEDERLSSLRAEDLRLVPETFRRRHPESHGAPCWFFFDEIHNVPGWERFLRRLIDTEPVSIVVSGSSSKLLSREIATSLRGRSLASELYPFSFAESLRHAGIDLPERWPPPANLRALLANRCRRYLEVGGFPEVQGLDEDLRLRILQGYVDVVLFRDVAERHGVDNLPALRQLQRALLAQPAGHFSVHRLHNDLRSQGIRVGKNTLHAYLDHFEDAFLLFPVTIASDSLRVRQSNPRKIYPIDPGLASAVSLRAARGRGHLLETVVYLELRRRGFEVSYVTTKSGFEVDFLVERPPGRDRLLFQVCLDLSEPRTRRRELRALEEALAENPSCRATVITLEEEGGIELGGQRVRIVPAWRWLLEPAPDSSAPLHQG